MISSVSGVPVLVDLVLVFSIFEDELGCLEFVFVDNQVCGFYW